MGFSGQEYWSGFSCPPPGDLLNPGIKHESPVSSTLAVESLPLSQGEAQYKANKLVAPERATELMIAQPSAPSLSLSVWL